LAICSFIREPNLSTGNEYAGAFLAYRAALIKLATPIVGCRDHAEDVVQEAFIRIAEYDDSTKPVRHPIAFIFQVVRHLALDRSRRLRLETRHSDAGDIPELVPIPIATPEETTIGRDRLRVVAEALHELPDACRLAFEMHRLGGYTHKEIALALGISPSLVDKHIRAALTHCRARLRQRSA
jgi:RNA polymerase sigma factor (sigma-70 family)